MHPKTSKRKAVLALTCQELLCRGLNPVLDLTTTALQRPVPPLEVRVTAGGRSFVEREVFWSELGVHGGSKGEGVPGDGVGSEPTAGAGGAHPSIMWRASHWQHHQPYVGCTVDGSQGPQTHLTSRNIYYRWQLCSWRAFSVGRGQHCFRRRCLNTEEKRRMNEMTQWQAVSLPVKMPEAARRCPWARRLKPLCHSVTRIYLTPLQAKANINYQNSFWAWFGG